MVRLALNAHDRRRLVHDHAAGKECAEGQKNRPLAQQWSKGHRRYTKPRLPIEVDATGRIGAIGSGKRRTASSMAARQLLVTTHGMAASGATKAVRTAACGLQQSF
jgi:hypothetical protein